MQFNNDPTSAKLRPLRITTVNNPGYFNHGNLTLSPPVPYTVVTADFLNDVQDEIGNLITWSGQTVGATVGGTVDTSQVLKAVQHVLYQPTITGPATVNGTTYLNGATTVSAPLVLTGGGSSLTVSGNTILQASLSVAGSSTLTGTVTTSGAMSVGNSLTVLGPASLSSGSMSSTLFVGGATTLFGPATTSGAMTVNGLATINNTLNLNGPANISGAVSTNVLTVAGTQIINPRDNKGNGGIIVFAAGTSGTVNGTPGTVPYLAVNIDNNFGTFRVYNTGVHILNYNVGTGVLTLDGLPAWSNGNAVAQNNTGIGGPGFVTHAGGSNAVSNNDVITALGYVPVNKAGDVITGALGINSSKGFYNNSIGSFTVVDDGVSGFSSYPPGIGNSNVVNSCFANGAVPLSIGMTTQGILIQFSYGSGNKGAQNTIGTVSVGSDNNSVKLTSNSDYRLKQNVVGLDHATSTLAKLNPVRFSWINGNGTVVDGFLAHEVQAVVPAAVTGTLNGTKLDTTVWDANGVAIDWAVPESAFDAAMEGFPAIYPEGSKWTGVTVPDYQTGDWTTLIPLMVAAQQEANGRISVLEATVQSLIDRITAIEASSVKPI